MNTPLITLALPLTRLITAVTLVVLLYSLLEIWVLPLVFLCVLFSEVVVDQLVKRLPVPAFKSSQPSNRTTDTGRQSTKSCALVTGASSGLGLEYAKLLAADGHDLVLVARSVDKLVEVREELESRHGVEVMALVKDLTKPGAAHEVFNEVQDSGRLIELLVNNAGFGAYGNFSSIPLEKQRAIVQLNIVALTELTHLVVGRLLQEEKPNGKIMNISSAGGFMPGPNMATYFATKAYVTNFTEALAYELKGTGITASVICPGPTATNFTQVAGDQNTLIFKYGPVMSAKQAAYLSYKAWLLGETVYMSGLENSVLVYLLPYLPRFILCQMVSLLH